jgi:hypothetical protein
MFDENQRNHDRVRRMLRSDRHENTSVLKDAVIASRVRRRAATRIQHPACVPRRHRGEADDIVHKSSPQIVRCIFAVDVSLEA